LPDGCVEQHVPAVAADFLVAAQQALAVLLVRFTSATPVRR